MDLEAARNGQKDPERVVRAKEEEEASKQAKEEEARESNGQREGGEEEKGEICLKRWGDPPEIQTMDSSSLRRTDTARLCAIGLKKT